MQLFRKLTPKQETKFRAWARANYKPLSPISGVWHPVVQDECIKINAKFLNTCDKYDVTRGARRGRAAG